MDIAKKYRGDQDVVNKMTANVNKGGTFGWNTGICMAAKCLGAFDREVKGMVEFIMSLPAEESSRE